ncbi:hypothetical protein K456DRAFT_59490 [Colletotrichum gloeosporioides 23]|nr:hypothetical protein K456DRAFT_59490 [Colletotrichum gloeosporioides 23]
MACGSTSTGLVNRNGPGSAASSIVESIVKPAEATGGKAKCFEVCTREQMGVVLGETLFVARGPGSAKFAALASF